MKTDNKTMIEVLQKVISNIENNGHPMEGIQVFLDNWVDKSHMDFYPKDYLYRIKPETITLKNGVTIPKPLDYSELNEDTNYFFVSPTKYMFDYAHADWIRERGIIFVYKTKEEAIEASKALFGIE